MWKLKPYKHLAQTLPLKYYNCILNDNSIDTELNMNQKIIAFFYTKRLTFAFDNMKVIELSSHKVI